MKPTTIQTLALVLACMTATPGCTAPSGAVADAQAGTPPTRHVASAAPDAANPAVTLVMHKSAGCGCCGVWAEHMRAAGFAVEERVTEDLASIKARVGLPYGMGSCHTAEVGGYFIEGHVPAQAVRRLLAERPDARGLTVPGMPIGSPGMEHPDGRVQPDAVLLVDAEGGTREYARHGH